MSRMLIGVPPGVLLYPTVREKLSEVVQLQGHEIHFVTINTCHNLGKNLKVNF